MCDPSFSSTSIHAKWSSAASSFVMPSACPRIVMGSPIIVSNHGGCVNRVVCLMSGDDIAAMACKRVGRGGSLVRVSGRSFPSNTYEIERREITYIYLESRC